MKYKHKSDFHDSKNNRQPIEGDVIVADPTPCKRIRLNNIKEVRLELSRVYREARLGTLQTSEATRLVYMLIALGNIIKDSELEERITALEKLNDSSAQK